MGHVVSSASMSLDGYIAHDDHTPGALFDWYGAGEVEVTTASPDLPPFRLTEASAAYWRAWTASLGAIVVGRTLFDVTDGWGGRHPLGVPVVVLSHRDLDGWDPPYGTGSTHLVTAGIEAALDLAQSLAGEATVGVAAGQMSTQAAVAGRLDRVNIDLVPIVMGGGRRYFGEHAVRLGDADIVVTADRVTHLSFPVEG